MFGFKRGIDYLILLSSEIVNSFDYVSPQWAFVN